VAKQAVNVHSQRALKELPPRVNVSASVVTGADGMSSDRRAKAKKMSCGETRRPLVNTISPFDTGPFEADVAGAFFISLVYEDDAIPPYNFHDPLLAVSCVSLDVSDPVRRVSFCEVGPYVSLVGKGEYIVEFSVGTIW
jgi:hypothetical protein